MKKTVHSVWNSNRALRTVEEVWIWCAKNLQLGGLKISSENTKSLEAGIESNAGQMIREYLYIIYL